MFSFFGKKKDSEYRRVLPFKKVVDMEQLDVETEKLWKCVSMGRSQFSEHYVGLIRNTALYIQDKDVFGNALVKAATALQGTMLVRLPGDRSREQGAKVEQLWKFAMFGCHLLRGASTVNRSWYKKNGEKLLFVDFSLKGLQYSEKDTETTSTLLYNLNQIIPGSSAQWLMEDDGKCVVQLNKAASGQVCFIDYNAVEREEQRSNELKKVEVQSSSMKTSAPVEKQKTEESGKTEIAQESNKTDKESSTTKKPAKTSGAKSKKKVNKSAAKNKTGSGKAVVVDIKSAGESVVKDKKPEQQRLFEANHEYIPEEVKEGEDPPVVQGMISFGSDSGVCEFSDNDAELAEGIGKQVIYDESVVETGPSETQKNSSFSIVEFSDWLDQYADWEISADGRKMFEYDQMVRRYLEETKSDIPIRNIGRSLVKNGFVHMDGKDARYMAVSEKVEYV